VTSIDDKHKKVKLFLQHKKILLHNTRLLNLMLCILCKLYISNLHIQDNPLDRKSAQNIMTHKSRNTSTAPSRYVSIDAHAEQAKRGLPKAECPLIWGYGHRP
jgi:hypothetical protein